ncbi:MAG TPA: ankyrin repeat domain-containing protein [Gaiellaceae bacterium]|nr:ankyrin repeat domain-containing protein [Gaiellaceae bacterium]
MSELLAAVYAGDRGAVERILAGEPELDVFEAAAVGRSERLHELLDGDASLVSAWSADGFTPLHLAAFFRHHETARLLVERGAPVDPVARHEQLRVTPLQSAVAAREVETAALLLERGADPNVRQEGAFTPLHAAARNGDDAAVDLLLAHGAEPGAAAADGRTAAEFAREGGHVALAERLAGLA